MTPARRVAPGLTDLGAEQLVLGALVRGTLKLADVDALPAEAWAHAHHLAIADLLIVALERGPVDLARVLRVGRRARIWPLGAQVALVMHDGRRVLRCLGYLPTLAREAPSRPRALVALRQIEEAAEARRLDASARARRSQSTEAHALRAALEAHLDGDEAGVLRAVCRVERIVTGVSGAELAELNGGGSR